MAVDKALLHEWTRHTPQPHIRLREYIDAMRLDVHFIFYVYRNEKKYAIRAIRRQDPRAETAAKAHS